MAAARYQKSCWFHSVWVCDTTNHGPLCQEKHSNKFNYERKLSINNITFSLLSTKTILAQVVLRPNQPTLQNSNEFHILCLTTVC